LAKALYFGLSDGWWLRGQARYDTALARETRQETLARIPRWSLLAAWLSVLGAASQEKPGMWMVAYTHSRCNLRTLFV
jgi:hypothetical protein